MKTCIALLLLGILAGGQHRGEAWTPTKAWMDRRLVGYVRPKDGYAGDAETAIAIGKAAISHIYGKEFVDDTGPYKAKLFGDIWVVYSHYIRVDEDGDIKTGGPTWVEVNKTTGAILNLDSER